MKDFNKDIYHQEKMFVLPSFHNFNSFTNYFKQSVTIIIELGDFLKCYLLLRVL